MKIFRKVLSITFFSTLIFVLFLYLGIEEEPPELPTPSREEIKEDYVEFWLANPENTASEEFYRCDFDYLYDEYGLDYIKKTVNECATTECQLPDGFYQSYERCKHLQ